MSAIVRLYAALVAAVAPVLSLAQSGGEGAGAPRADHGGMSWLWWIVAAVVLFALVRMFFGRNRRNAEAGRRL